MKTHRLLFTFALFLCCYSSSVQKDSKKTSAASCKKSYYQLVFMGREKFHKSTDKNEKFSCNWLNSCGKLKKKCAKRKGLAKVLWNARKLAVKHCESEFRFDQWDCRFSSKFLKNIVYRETAYMQAISAATLAYSIATACSEGSLQGCKCAKNGRNPLNNKWHWGGCGHNIKFAEKLSRNFMKISNSNISTQTISRHNFEIGFKSIRRNVERKCRCHGLSGSCHVKTCWKNLKPFETVSENLKREYHNAIFARTGNTFEEVAEGSLLVFSKHTPSLCKITTGRRCNDTDNCATLCCGRGFYMKTMQLIYFCNCDWRNNSFNGDSLVCEQCEKNQDVNICK